LSERTADREIICIYVTSAIPNLSHVQCIKQQISHEVMDQMVTVSPRNRLLAAWRHETTRAKKLTDRQLNLSQLHNER